MWIVEKHNSAFDPDSFSECDGYGEMFVFPVEFLKESYHCCRSFMGDFGTVTSHLSSPEAAVRALLSYRAAGFDRFVLAIRGEFGDQTSISLTVRKMPNQGEFLELSRNIDFSRAVLVDPLWNKMLESPMIPSTAKLVNRELKWNVENGVNSSAFSTLLECLSKNSPQLTAVVMVCLAEPPTDCQVSLLNQYGQTGECFGEITSPKIGHYELKYGKLGENKGYLYVGENDHYWVYEKF